MKIRVCDLVGGDIVQLDLSERTATFIGRSDHPLYETLALVVWRLQDGSISLDALDYMQEVGDRISRRHEWYTNLALALDIQ
jgi:hypothetical protein